MSKYVKDLVVQDLRHRLAGVQDGLLVNVVGLDANKTVVLRKQLRERGIHLLVVKNSLAKRATEGTSLGAAFAATEGTLAMVWGGTDFVSLAKDIIALGRNDQFAAFQTRGGVLDGEPLTPERVKDISRWPNRLEQLSLLMGQILGPGARLSAQLLGPGGALASQIEEQGKKAGPAEAPSAAQDETPAEPAGETPAGSTEQTNASEA